MNGFGEFIWSDGKKYIGMYEDDKKDGFGMFYWPETKKVYVGYWKEGKQDGFGRTIKKSYNKFGFWAAGKRQKTFKTFWEFEKNKRITESDSKFFKMDFSNLLKFIENKQQFA